MCVTILNALGLVYGRRVHMASVHAELVDQLPRTGEGRTQTHRHRERGKEGLPVFFRMTTDW